MKKFKKLMIAGLATVMAVGVMSSFAACGGKKTELTVHTMFGAGDSHNLAFKTLNKQFELANENVTIKDISEVATAQNYVSNFERDLDSGLIDVAFYFTGAKMADRVDKLVSVADMQKENANIGKNIKSHDDDDYSVELKGTTQGVFYRNSAKAAVEGSFSGLVTALAAGDTVKSGDTSKVPHYWFNHMMCHYLGIAEFNAFQGNKSYFDDAAKKTLWIDAAYNSLTDMHKFMQGSFSGKLGDGGDFFANTNGENVYVDGSWSAGKIDTAKNITEDPINVGTLKDKDEKDFTIGGFTSGWYITKTAWEDPDKRAAALAYVELQSSDDAIDMYCSTAGGVPANGKGASVSTEGMKKFAEATKGTICMPIDDRVSAAAKTALLGNFEETAGTMPAMLNGSAAITKEAVTKLFSEFIGAL